MVTKKKLKQKTEITNNYAEILDKCFVEYFHMCQIKYLFLP